MTDTMLNLFLAIAVDNLATAQEMTAAMEAEAAEEAVEAAERENVSVGADQVLYIWSKHN